MVDIEINFVQDIAHMYLIAHSFINHGWYWNKFCTRYCTQCI